MEKLEDRLLLASDWQNPSRPLDVNNDGQATPIDALQILNRLSRAEGEGQLGVRTNRLASYPDTSGDGMLSPRDALHVINGIARSNDGRVYDYSTAEAEGDLSPTGFTSIMFMTLPGNGSDVVDLETSFEFTAEQFNELGYFVVDSAEGELGGMMPTDPDYPETVFNSPQRHVVYSKFSADSPDWTKTVPAGKHLGVYVLQPADDNGHPDNHLRVKTQPTIGAQAHGTLGAPDWLGDACQPMARRNRWRSWI